MMPLLFAGERANRSLAVFVDAFVEALLRIEHAADRIEQALRGRSFHSTHNPSAPFDATAAASGWNLPSSEIVFQAYPSENTVS